MTHLRQQMLDELQRRNYSQNTVYTYIHAVEDFAKYFHRSPDAWTRSHPAVPGSSVSRPQASPGPSQAACAALRFLFVKTLRRPYLPDAHSISQASPATARLCSAQKRWRG